jgi:cytochrome b561
MLKVVRTLSHKTIGLHWLVGILIIGLLMTGIYIMEFGGLELYLWHKAIGVVIVLPILVRIIVRIYEGFPAPLTPQVIWIKYVVKTTHIALLTGTVLRPLSGFLMSATGGYGVYFLGLELVARRVNPLDPEKVVPINETISVLGHNIHHWLGYVMLTALALHIAGVLKHHFIDKDITLTRMLNK